MFLFVSLYKSQKLAREYGTFHALWCCDLQVMLCNSTLMLCLVKKRKLYTQLCL